MLRHLVLELCEGVDDTFLATGRCPFADVTLHVGEGPWRCHDAQRWHSRTAAPRRLRTVIARRIAPLHIARTVILVLLVGVITPLAALNFVAIVSGTGPRPSRAIRSQQLEVAKAASIGAIWLLNGATVTAAVHRVIETRGAAHHATTAAVHNRLELLELPHLELLERVLRNVRPPRRAAQAEHTRAVAHEA